MAQTQTHLTGALFKASWPFSMHPQLASKVLLPEFRKPHIPSVVGERAATEVAIERYGKRGEEKKEINIWL